MHHVLTPRVHIRPLIQKGGYPEKGRFDEKTDEKYGVVPPEKEKRCKPPTSLDDDSDRLHYPPDWSPTDVVDMIADSREVVASREEIARSEAFIRRAEARLRRMARNVARRQRRGNADAL